MKADEASLPAKISRLVAGKNLRLSGGQFRQPITICGKRGSEEQPIIIRGPRAVIGSDVDFEGYRRQANELAAAHEAGGSFPGVYFLADDAALVLKDCQWVTIEDLTFENCWPTAIYLDNCQHVTIRNVHFRGGTIAIGAFGANTRHLLIEDCSWVQDVSGDGQIDVERIRAGKPLRGDAPKGRLWNEICWRAVHGTRGDNEPGVNIKTDARALDGDFFRAWTIAGYVILRNNVIADAFNGIHFFNQASESTKTAYCRNVLIEGNWFVRIRDNAIEPEDYAWNWTISGNTFVDCYMPFSFEMYRSGYFYIFGNVGWNRYVPGPEDDDHNSGQLFKFGDAHAADGPHYVLHNTWQLRWPISKKKRFSGLVHSNNVIGYSTGSEGFDTNVASPFGKGWDIKKYPLQRWDAVQSLEDKYFTRQWRSLDIVLDGDLVDHPHYPVLLRQAGYAIGQNAKTGPAVFANPTSGLREGLKLASPPASIPVIIQLPDGETLLAGRDGVVGAWQGSKPFRLETARFTSSWPGGLS